MGLGVDGVNLVNTLGFDFSRVRRISGGLFLIND